MSLHDDYFDCRDALNGKPEAVAFYRIWKAFCHLEKEHEKAAELVSHFKSIQRILSDEKERETKTSN